MTADRLATAFELAWEAALLSPDPSTQNGAVLVNEHGGPVYSGCNHLSRGIPATPENLEPARKYPRTVHAEQAALFAAVSGPRFGADWEPLSFEMVALWAPCSSCALAIVASGVRRLHRHGWFLDRSPDRWKESIALGDELLEAGGVEVVRHDAPIDTRGKPLRFNGELVLPWGKA